MTLLQPIVIQKNQEKWKISQSHAKTLSLSPEWFFVCKYKLDYLKKELNNCLFAN